MKPSKLTPHELEELLARVLLNQRAEGVELDADELAEVQRRLADEHISGLTWSPSWDCLVTVARILRRPDLVAGGRRMELFASSVAICAATNIAEAWREIERAHAEGRRGLVLGALEMIEHGPPSAERTDPARFRLLTSGIAAARAAGLTARIAALLRANSSGPRSARDFPAR
jgi:hypothetical protein